MNKYSLISESNIQSHLNGRMTLQNSKANINAYEITNENVDDNPFDVAEDYEKENEISNDATENGFNMNMENPILKAFFANTRHSSPIPKKPVEKPKKTMADLIEGFHQAQSNSSSFMSLRKRQNSIAQKRIEKCNRTIQKCQMEKQRLAAERQRRISCPIKFNKFNEESESDLSTTIWQQPRCSDQLLNDRPFSRDARVQENVQQLSAA